VQVQESATGEVRYTMHELVRQFAAEELHTAGEAPAVAMKHSRYYLDYLAARGLRLGRQEPKEASAEIQAELDNIRLAWQWAATQGCLEELDQASYSWWIFCMLQAMDVEARSSFAQAISGVRQQIAAHAEDAEDDTGARTLRHRLLAKLLAIHADLLFARGHDEEMAAQAQEAIDLGAASGGVEGEALGTFVLGRVAQDAEQRRKAGDLWRRAIQLVNAYLPTHPACELLHEVNWMAHNWLRGNALGFGDYANSRTYISQARQICRTLGKRRGELFCLVDMAQLDFLLFDVAAAEVDFTAALDLARTLNYLRMEMRAQAGLAEVLRLRGDYTTARTLLEEALTAVTVLASPYDEALILAALIRVHEQIGNQAAAMQRYEQLTQLLARIKLPRECQLYGYLAAAIMAHNAGDNQVALHYAEQANQLNKPDGEILFRRVDTALILGHTRAAAAQWEAAAAAFQLALDAFQQFGNRALAAEPQAGLAHIALAQDDLAGAQALVEAILPLLAEEAHAGYNDPAFIYLTCYRVLLSNRDKRAAALLQQGYDLLQQDAAALDAEDRQRFFSAVPLHRALVTTYTER
jgi:hypothetical protein